MSPNLLVKCSLQLTLEIVSTNTIDINDFFNDIIKDGGNLAAKYDENKRVRVLLVQTHVQFKALSEVRPNLFFTDTTFGTNKEEYKLHLPTYVSVVTGETEVKK